MPEPLPAALPTALLGAEWLEADGLGGFASGTVGGARTRRYHALLLAAPRRRRAAWCWSTASRSGSRPRAAASRSARSATRRTWSIPTARRGSRISSREPWPNWTFRTEDGTEVSQEIVACHGRGDVVVRWRAAVAGRAPARLIVRPLLSGRDYHALHHENPGFAFGAEVTGARVLWRPYPGSRRSRRCADGGYRAGAGLVPQLPVRRRARARPRLRRGPGLARRLQLDPERPRGEPDAVGGRGRPRGRAGLPDLDLEASAPQGLPLAARARRRRLRRAARPRQDDRRRLPLVHRLGPRHLHRAARLHDPAGRARRSPRTSCSPGPARSPKACCPTASPTPARRPSSTRSTPRSGTSSRSTSSCRRRARGRRPATVSDAAPARSRKSSPATRRHPLRHRMDEDGLLAAGVPGVQLTWMDAKVGDWVVTPRIGKPVEVQALWLNALKIARRDLAPSGATSTATRSRPSSCASGTRPRGCLYDVVDVDHEPGRNDPTMRPNQILAVGGLPYQVLVEPYATRVVDAVERQLLTPLGLRSLAPSEPGYRPHYGGGVLRARRRLPPGHGLALADGAVRRGLAARPRQQRRRPTRGGRALPRPAARPPRGRRARPRLRGRRRRAAATGRAAARSRPGRSASSCAPAAAARRAAEDSLSAACVA